ncbi:MAG: hypothetical protein U0790_15075 [Isosphaeraceae bacterium]
MRSLLRQLLGVLRGGRTAWSIFGLVLLLIALGEFGLRGIFWLKDRGQPAIPPDPRVLEALDGSAAWLPVHYRELESLNDRWQPFVYFRQRPFRGRTITVDEDGTRAIWKPAGPRVTAADKASPLKLLLLGGSSLWGFGARDDRTIPSHLARKFHERGIAVEVRSLAEIGYVNTQEVIALARELQAGYRPDLVLFYDGVNDTTSALLERRAAVSTNEVNRVREFNILQSPSRLAAALGSNLVRHSAWYRLAGSIGRRLAPPAAREPGSSAELRPLAREVVRCYAANMTLVKALGRAYGFRALFAWQPVIFRKAALVPFEREESDKFGWTRELFRQVREELETSPAPGSDPDFIDLSGIFEQTAALVFLDFCHTTEAANETIAEELIERLAPAIERHGERRGRPRKYQESETMSHGSGKDENIGYR